MAYAPDSFSSPDEAKRLSRSGRECVSKTASSTDSNKTLDFNQAMGDFRSMFPGMDEEIIEAVLRANNGAVDATIDQLLSMSMGNEEMGIGIVPEACVSGVSDPPSLPRKDSVDEEDLPPSYEQAVKDLEDKTPKQMSTAKNRNLMSDLLLLSPAEPYPCASQEPDQFEVFMPSSSPPAPSQAEPHPCDLVSATTIKSHGNEVDLLSSDLSAFNFSLAAACSSNIEQTIPKTPVSPPPLPSPRNTMQPPQKYSTAAHDMKSPRCSSTRGSEKKPFRKWNPPLLGTLPDDFLRLEPIPKLSSFAQEQSSFDHATHHPVMLSRRSSTPVSSRFTAQRSPGSNRPKRTQSLVVPSSMPCDLRRNRPERSSGRESTILNQTRTELNQKVLRQKMAENEQKRSSLSAEFDPELVQQLQDEKLALALQNEEFLESLQQNEDFMKTLERDRMNATAFEPGPDSDDDHHAGYGEDKTPDPVGAFPFTKVMPPEEENDQNAEFKKQLSQMGQSSKKKLQALARKFMSKKRKKSPKQVLKESSAPSTLNLLEDYDEDLDDLDDHQDEDRPIFEPQPGSQLSTVPSYKTVQRPMYHPDTVITHPSDDMV